MATQDTLLDRLVVAYPDTSKQSLRKWIKQGRVLCNDRVMHRGDAILQAEDVIALDKKKVIDLPFKMLYQDSDIIVVDKPAGMLSVASLDPSEKNVHEFLKRMNKREKNRVETITPLHRLDKEVAGPLIFVKNQNVLQAFKNLFTEQKIHREYRAIVHYNLEKKKGTLRSYLKESDSYRVSETPLATGKESITHYEVLKETSDFSLLRITLQTGRKNQIRVHLSGAGHPIVGDVKYGAEPLLLDKAIALYADHLEFIHPITHKKMYFQSEPPFVFRHLLKKTGLLRSDNIGK